MNDSAGQIEIRRADVSDAGLVSVLGTVTFYEAYFEQDDPYSLTDYIHESFAPDKIRAEIEDKNALFFIIFLNQHAVGYAKLRTDSELDCIKNETAIELQRIYVVERVFGKGIGERLLKHCLEAAKSNGFETLWLGVWEENKRGQRFYEKHGFRRVGTLTFPYGESVGINFVLEKVL
jgi:diamine N-acetyltransferase